MSKYEQLKALSDVNFRRLTGVKPHTFDRMLAVFTQQLQAHKRVAGRPAKCCPADQLLMMLEYHREYRTYFHIAQNYGLSEANAYRAIRRAETLLIRSGAFALPGRKTLLQADTAWSVVVVDASETPIQRPQKDRPATTRPRKSTTT